MPKTTQFKQEESAMTTLEESFYEMRFGWIVGLIETRRAIISYCNGTQLIGIKVPDRELAEKFCEILRHRFDIDAPIELMVRDADDNSFVVKVEGEKARTVMRAIYPYMGSRRKEQIDASLRRM
jgi:hypothetical protein